MDGSSSVGNQERQRRPEGTETPPLASNNVPGTTTSVAQASAATGGVVNHFSINLNVFCCNDVRAVQDFFTMIMQNINPTPPLRSDSNNSPVGTGTLHDSIHEDNKHCPENNDVHNSDSLPAFEGSGVCCVCCDRDISALLPCKHLFCEPCVFKLLADDLPCPLCMRSFVEWDLVYP